MSVVVGPIRFNNDPQADHFRDWVHARTWGDFSSLEDWDIQRYFDEYCEAMRLGDRSRSGTPTTPNAKRTRPMVTVTLSPEALARLDEIAKARGMTRSGAVEALIRNARLRETK